MINESRDSITKIYMYYKLRQALFYYKLMQVLLQIRAAIANEGNRYYKTGHLWQNLLQIWAGITNYGN